MATVVRSLDPTAQASALSITFKQLNLEEGPAIRPEVIGVIALSSMGLTVPGIARVLGQSRQAVQRITDVMVTDGLLSYHANPKHKRSVLVVLTEEGRAAYKDLRDVQDPWAIQNTDDISIEELDAGLRLVRRLIQKFDK
jgi:DNA-binding MarR family transcriptional regulator